MGDGGCLTEDQALGLFQGSVAPELRRGLDAHLDGCPDCRQLVAALARGAAAMPSGAQAPTERPGSLPAIGALLAGRFRLTRLVGRGGMGVVYEATDVELGVQVAVKFLHPELAGRPELMRQLYREILVARRVTHENVCRVYDLGSEGRLRFTTMEFVEGHTLAEELRERRLPPQEARRVLEAMCAGLEAAHRSGVVHRDLKPANVMWAGGRVKVTDFGLARDLHAQQSLLGGPLGTPAYWAPEQARGEPATPATDVFALGIVACELYGVPRPLLSADVDRSVAALPRWLRPIVARCLRERPQDRWPSAIELGAALQRGPEGEPRRAWRWALGALVVVGLGAASGYAVVSADPERAIRLPVAVAPVRSTSVAGEKGFREAAAPSVAIELPASSLPDDPDGARAPAGSAESDRAAGPTTPPGRRRRASSHHGKGKMAQVPVHLPAAPTGEEEQQGFQQRLQALARLRESRGLLVEDLPDYPEAHARASAAAQRRHFSEADAMLERLERSVREVRIDRTFVAGKLERLTTRASSARLDVKTSEQVRALFSRFHTAYFAGDLRQANAHLTEIGNALGAH